MTKEVAIKKKESFWERNKKSNGLLLKKRAKSIAISMIRAILLFGMCFMILQPILNKISVSFMAEEDLYNAMVISIPEHFTTANYQLANQFMEYWSTLRNTLLVSFTIAILQIGVCTIVGYGFARFEFPLKKFWFACVMLVIIIPPQTISTSLYLHFRFFDILGIFKAADRKYFEFKRICNSVLFDECRMYGVKEWIIYIHDPSVFQKYSEGY